MPAVIVIGAVNSNTPQQNTGIFIGEYNLGGWDANMKQNQAKGGLYGFFNVIPLHFNLCVDSMEAIDGIINDQDVKPMGTANL